MKTEIRPQRQVIMLDNTEPEVIFEECLPEDATHWSIFDHNGTHLCDCLSRETAELLNRLLGSCDCAMENT